MGSTEGDFSKALVPPSPGDRHQGQGTPLTIEALEAPQPAALEMLCGDKTLKGLPLSLMQAGREWLGGITSNSSNT